MGRGASKQPRGMPAKVIAHMEANQDQVTWTIPELAQILGVEDKAVTQLLRAVVGNGWLHRYKVDDRTVYSLEPEVVEETPFSATRHLDGDIDLFGLAELENGGHRLSKEAAKQLRDLMGSMS